MKIEINKPKTSLLNYVKEERTKQGMSRKTLAELVEITPQAIYLIETEQRIPSVLIALKISHELKININYLFELL